MNKRHYILTLLLFCTSLLFAQDTKFTASVNRNQVGTGEQFEVDFSVNGNADRFSPPDFSGFQIAGGPNQSTSMESINGNTTMSTSYSYILVSMKEGDFTIGPASIVVNGRKLTTNPIKIKVVKGVPVPQMQRSQGQQQQQQQSAPDQNIAAGSPVDVGKSLFLRAVVNKNNVYQGQELTLTYRLYTRVSLVQSELNKLPDLTGFWNEDIKNPQQQQVTWRTEMYKGQKFNVADIKQIILFPEHAGNITIDPFEMTFIARIPTPGKDMMEQLFGGGYNDVKYNAKSIPLVVHVKPLPEAGRPADFTGAVGNFAIVADLDKNHIKANESLNYKVKVMGAGNIKLLKTLNTGFPADFEKYDPKISDTVTEGANGVAGTRIYNYLLIPRHQGDFTIDPVKFSYFNPSTGKYISLATKSFPVKVDKGIAESNVTALTDADKQDVKLLNKDIRYIKTGDADLSKNGGGFYGSGSYYLLLLLGPVLCAAVFGYRKWNQKNNSDMVKVKSRKASRVAAKHLANAQQQLLAHNTKAFYEAVFKGLYGYLSDKLNISAADLNKETIASTLKAKSVNDGLISQLLETLDLCEMARYAPVTHIAEKEVFEKAKGIINNMENEI
jgi:hypothetical protein